MNDLLTGLEAYIPTIAVVAGALIAILAAAIATLAWLIRLSQRWRDYAGKRKILKPSTWFKIQPKALFKIKSEILANRAVRELYAPEAHYVRDLRENEQAWKLAWLSPFPRAVKASIKASNTTKGKKLDARKQIAEVARRIDVCSLPSDVLVGNGMGDDDAPEGESEQAKQKRLKKQERANRENHFRINLDLTGEDPAVVNRVVANITTQLKLDGGMEYFPTRSAAVTSYLAHREPMADLLTETKIGASFFKENPAKSVYALPLGITPDMKPWLWETHHTMIFGMTGSGKGSPIQGAIFQLAPFVKQGTCKIMFADPKNAEARVYNEWPSRLIDAISVGMDEEDMVDHAKIFADLKKEIGRRSKHGTKTSIKEGEEDDGRDFEASKENPLILLIIDEFPTLFKGFEQLGRDGKKPLSDLAQIILTGRSYGVYILAATQRGDKLILDAVIDSMQHKICLRQTNPYFNKLFLGDDYSENGNDPAKIKKATKANKYKTAGIGFIADDEGQSKLRFAYISKVEIAALVREFRALDGLPIDEDEMTDFIDSTNEWQLPDLGKEEEPEEIIPEDAERSLITIEDFVIEDDLEQ